MAKLKGPLFSLGASQQIGKALVYFSWKGLNVVRQHVVPSNPNTDPQKTQRGYLTEAVNVIHEAQALAADMLAEIDQVAYALLGSTHPTPRTWFNEAIKGYIDQLVDSKYGAIYGGGVSTPAVDELDVEVNWTEYGATDILTGNFWYGTSKTSLIHSELAAIAAHQATATLPLLTTGLKYYWQFRPITDVKFVGANSGIYHGTPL